MNEIQSIKEKFGQTSENIISTGLNLQRKGSKYRCPNNHAHKHGDRNPSLSWDPNALHYHCFTCGMNIDLYDYYREHLNYTHQEILRELLGVEEHAKTTLEIKRNEFREELKKIKPITQECIDYIKLRGLTEETIKAFELMSYENDIVFPYFRYETITGYKRRKPIKNPGNPKMLSLKGSKPYMFNSKNITDREELIICEGEFDCMCISQCGYKNVVSVGAGANSMTALLDQADEFLKQFEYLIIVSDNDEAGSNMDKIFLDKYKDKIKLIDKNLYTKNDINEQLVLVGIESVKAIIESGRFKIEGRRNLDKTPYKGITKRAGNYIPTGIPTIDDAINDLMPGCVTLLTGRSNGGKTTLIKQIIANAINYNNKVYVMSGEGDQETFINELYQCVIGRNNLQYDITKVNKKFHKEPKPEILKALQEWHRHKLVLFNKGESNLKTTEQLFKMVEKEVKEGHYNLIIIDNLMSILSAKAIEKNEAQADFMQRCHDIANCYRVHIVLVLHPNKEYRKGQDMDFEQISGTSDLPNKADNVISVIREYDETKIQQGINGKIAVLKNRYYTQLPFCNIHFEEETGQLMEIKGEDCIVYKFNIEKYMDMSMSKNENQEWWEGL